MVLFQKSEVRGQKSEDGGFTAKFFTLLFPFIITCVLNLAPFASDTHASATVSLSWNKNLESDLAGYKIHYGTASKNYQHSVDVKKSTSCDISGLEEGKTYYFAVTAYDNNNNESYFSEELVHTIPMPPLLPPPVDTDGDGILDDGEISIYGTDPDKADTDGDGINDGDELALWEDNWNADFDGDGLINLLDKDSDNDDYPDGSPPPPPPPPPPPTITPLLVPTIEVGELQLDHNWTRVDLKKSFMEPVVVAQPLSLNGSDPAVVRIRNVDRIGFEIRVQEWDYLDGLHTKETVGYLIMEGGSYALEDGTLIEAGTFETNKVGSFDPVTFSQTFQLVPVISATIASFNEKDAVTGRIRNLSTDGFEFCMQEQELNPKNHLREIVNYIAWEPSTGNVGNLIFDVGSTGNVVEHGFHIIQFDQSLMNDPVFLADMQTSEGMDTADIRWRNKNKKSVEVQINEEQSRNSETDHTTEVVGYMAFSPTNLNEDTVKIWLEAEDGYLESPMQIDTDDNASKGKYIWIPNGYGFLGDPYQDAGSAIFIFEVPTAGEYTIWCRTWAPNGNDDSFFVSIDSGDYLLWDTKIDNNWVWDRVGNGGSSDPVVYNFEQGEHSLIIKHREDGTKIDRIVISSDLENAPESD